MNKPPKKPIPPKVRTAILTRDGYTCQLCGARPPSAAMCVSLIVPLEQGGTDDTDNLFTICDECRFGRSAKPGDPLQPLTERAKIVAANEKKFRALQHVFQARRDRLEGQAWEVIRAFGHTEDTFRSDWFTSTVSFLEKLTLPEVRHAAELALARYRDSIPTRWKYFCGICWNRIKEAEAHERAERVPA
jgi:hypothetical protein